MTGVVGMAAGLLRIGFLASFICEPVLKGFIVGLALTLVVGKPQWDNGMRHPAPVTSAFCTVRDIS